jgi:hypothetical protein
MLEIAANEVKWSFFTHPLFLLIYHARTHSLATLLETERLGSLTAAAEVLHVT